jgi:hypothetical protein
MGGSGKTFEELGADNLVEIGEWEEAVRRLKNWGRRIWWKLENGRKR